MPGQTFEPAIVLVTRSSKKMTRQVLSAIYKAHIELHGSTGLVQTEALLLTSCDTR